MQRLGGIRDLQVSFLFMGTGKSRAGVRFGHPGNGCYGRFGVVKAGDLTEVS